MGLSGGFVYNKKGEKEFHDDISAQVPRGLLEW